MKQSISVGGTDAYEVLRNMTNARRALEEVGNGLLASLPAVCEELYSGWGITGLLLIHEDGCRSGVELDYLGQAYRIGFRVDRENVGGKLGRSAFDYYLVMGAWKRVIPNPWIAERGSLEEEQGIFWRPLGIHRYVDSRGTIYRDREGDVMGGAAEDELRELVTEMLITGDCAD